MARFALWALAAALVAVIGCANILGFKDFTADAGENGTGRGSASTVSTRTTSTDPSLGSASATTGGGTGSTGAGTGTASASVSGSATSGSGTASSSPSSTSNANPTAPCTWGDAFNGGGSFTWYFFGQGTFMQNGQFKTACGFTGSETGSGQGATDTVSNIANSAPAGNTYFAAIPGMSSGNFDTVTSCGACVEITNGGKKIVATVIDECPQDTNPACGSGHLDLSTQAFDALGYSVGNPSGTTWKFVPCPITGNIQAVQNSSGQYYLQNSVFPITSVNGQAPTNFGYFNVNPGSSTISSGPVNQTITITIPGGGGDTGAQFTAPSDCF